MQSNKLLFHKVKIVGFANNVVEVLNLDDVVGKTDNFDFTQHYITVVTDGNEAIPASAVPYEVLWVLTINNGSFQPGYGRVTLMEG